MQKMSRERVSTIVNCLKKRDEPTRKKKRRKKSRSKKLIRWMRKSKKE